MMRHPAFILQSLDRASDAAGKRFVLIGQNPFILDILKRVLTGLCSTTDYESIDEAGVRSSYLYLRDKLLTVPLPWEQPLVWVDQADLLLNQMSLPEDLPSSSHCLVLLSSNIDTYIPPSFTAVLLDPKGKELQDFIRWQMLRKGLNGETDAIRFLASEYKDDLVSMDKMLDQIALELHPRTVLSMKDLEATGSDGWDSTGMLHSIIKNEETKVLAEMVKALETFHPKGVVTVMTRRVNLLMQVKHTNLVTGGQPESMEIKPWVWRQNVELVKEIPLRRLAQWAVILDRTYAQLSQRSVSYRWTLSSALLEMTRSV